MKFPQHITFTGIDERTDLSRCARISSRWPVEWGVLIGGRLGKNRYPSEVAIHRAVDTSCRFAMPISLHACGKFAQEANQGKAPVFAAWCRRMQVNMASNAYDLAALLRLAAQERMTIIVQCRGVRFPEPVPGLQYLFDRSGGKGVLPTHWPIGPAGQLVGYAGGINPDNAAEVVSRIQADRYWIDMETGVRTEDWLDLDKCEAVCRAVYGG